MASASSKVKRAMEKAREIEGKKLMSEDEVVETYKEGVLQAEKLRKLLMPSWFVKDVHKRKKMK